MSISLATGQVSVGCLVPGNEKSSRKLQLVNCEQSLDWYHLFPVFVL